MANSDVFEVYSPNVRETCSNCTFLPRAEKYQKSAPKGDEPTVRPLWTPPLPWGWLMVGGITLIDARHRRGSVRIALPRLCWSTVLSPVVLYRGFRLNRFSVGRVVWMMAGGGVWVDLVKIAWVGVIARWCLVAFGLFPQRWGHPRNPEGHQSI